MRSSPARGNLAGNATASAFRRFRDEIYRDRHDEQLITAWNAFRNARTERRAVDWLLDNQQITEETADRYRTAHPDPEVP